MRAIIPIGGLVVAALCVGSTAALGQGVPTPTPTPAPAAAAPAAPAGETGTAEKKPAAASTALDGVFKDGFTLRTPDKKSELKLQASVQLDARGYGGDSVAPSSFDIRRARIDFNAKLYDYIAVRIQAALEDNPYIRNAYMDIGRRETFKLRIGQMKVPFSTQWLTLDNRVDFLERGSDTPVYPFFDRGLLVWGTVAKGTTTYSLGVFNGNGVDVEGTKGDIDDHKDAAARLFLQPFRNSQSRGLKGLYLVGQGTYALTSAPTRRFETRGLMAANYESLLWRWRTEQIIGSNVRNTDQIAGEIDSRTRLGAEVNYILGPFSASVEWAETEYEGIAVYHDFWVGSKRLKHDPVLARDGKIRNTSVWLSYFLTGESKLVDTWGWTQPSPARPYWPGNGNRGAWELLARYSSTSTDPQLFDTVRVNGFTAADFPAPPPVVVGEGGSVTAAVLEGAPEAREVSLGLNWTMNYNFRILFDWTYIWAPEYADGKNGIVSGGNSELADLTEKNRIVESEHMLGMRFIFRI